MKWLIYGIVIFLCYLMFTHNPQLILWVGGGLLLYWFFFGRKKEDKSWQYWQAELSKMKEQNMLLNQLILTLQKVGMNLRTNISPHDAPQETLEISDETNVD
jgi:hypothetical protein